MHYDKNNCYVFELVHGDDTLRIFQRDLRTMLQTMHPAAQRTDALVLCFEIGMEALHQSVNE
jgi:hypothetical protein